MDSRRVRMLTHASGPGLNVKPGEVVLLPVETCAAMVEGGYAVYVDQGPVPAPISPPTAPEPAPEPAPTPEPEPTSAVAESASLESTEAAVQPRARGRQRA